ncbi:MAG: hypothetical protein QW333_02265 [Fervidicoccaceae archaeon]
MIVIEVDDKGFLMLTNSGDKPVTIWKIEFTYYIYTSPLKKNEEDRSGRRLITESVDKKIELHSGQSIRYYTKLPREVIKEVVVYYEDENSFKKSYVKLQP